MTSTKTQILIALLSGHSTSEAVLFTTPNSIQNWGIPEQCTQFITNPQTGITSWIKYPNTSVADWTPDIIKNSIFDAGKPNNIVTDAEMDLDEFWEHNKHTPLNDLYFKNLVLNKFYRRFVKKHIDISSKYETADTQFFTILAKAFCDEFSFLPNRNWFEKLIYPVIELLYPKDLAKLVIDQFSITDQANNTITRGSFETVGPFKDSDVKNFLSSILYWFDQYH